MKIIGDRLYKSCVTAFPIAGKTIVWLLKIILPISLAVSLLQYWGIISEVSKILSPVFSIIGLPGESAIVFISSIFLSLYAPIAIITTLSLDMREITILALMCLISHNMIVETAIQKKTGSSAFIMFSVRIIMSFIGAFILNYFLPQHFGAALVTEKLQVFTNLQDMITNWLISSSWLCLKIILIVTGLMILQNILKEFQVLDVISKLFAPLMLFLGLDKESSFLWFVAQTLGLTYGSAVMVEVVKQKQISAQSANLLNYHIAVNHSLLEDTLLFVAIGVPAGWIVTPRFFLAFFLVWFVRGIHLFFRKKQKNTLDIF